MLINSPLSALSKIASPLVSFDPVTDKLVAIDLTSTNTELTPAIINNIDDFSSYIDRYLQDHQAKFAVGGYNEHRTMYSKSELFNTGDDEPRRLHLGTDIWGKVNTPIMAPLSGSIHSIANNNMKGDYGGTIIIEHAVADRKFYTLYGHLSLASLDNKQAGQIIAKGETIAWLGNEMENGDWPPHLHFQLILDIGDNYGDYPGVCKYSERAYWLSNSPDPDLIINMNQFIHR